ncbi:hypothetical protein M5M_07195 [Simiduia agarivorans SA1 = DSM 21679]|uniref:Uncharacterized protein n=1 Tax=Simiduia agarivorans (strain DSM 21679 / JCM 13881 / BCRC 17597 / SA1) TaxID=1117647 RepID=K4KHN9_SIMAS|nr:hypothetical protein M5M_07195 [Simiduia agarivorans SA1 = DSM 21679]
MREEFGVFDIVFRGDIAPGHQLPQVKQRMAALFKRTPEQIEPLFAGTPVPLKKNVDAEAAEKSKKCCCRPARWWKSGPPAP